MISQFPQGCREFEPLARAAFEKWAPKATVIFKQLKGGRSGAAVLKVDVRDGGSVLESGNYILKLSRHSDGNSPESEITAHRRAWGWNESYSQEHVPVLRLNFNNDDENLDPTARGYAMLFEIAGHSLDLYAPTDTEENSAFSDVANRISGETLRAWTRKESIVDLTVDDLLATWLQHRLDPSRGKRLHDFVRTRMGSESRHLDESGETILNPLAFVELARTKGWPKIACVTGLLHGDLHGGNVLVYRNGGNDAPYWVIDFELSSQGPVGFDQAYLELAHILLNLGNEDPAKLFALLKYLNNPSPNTPRPARTHWLSMTLREYRNAQETWRDDDFRLRPDDINRQLTLARVAAGLNWANKRDLSEAAKYVALCYGGWFARQYLEQFHGDDARSVWRSKRADTEPPVSSPADDELWNALWNGLQGFSPLAGKYLLVAGALSADAKLRAVGQLPWSAVIDLDPGSDETGLRRYAEPILQRHRAVHTYSRELPVVNYNRGTAWLMSAGWTLKSEAATDYDNWCFDKLHIVRTLAKALNDAVDPSPLYVLAIPGASLDERFPMARVSKVLSAIHEFTRGRAKIFVLGDAAPIEYLPHELIPLTLDVWLTRLESIYGVRATPLLPQLPAQDGIPRTIPIDLLRALQENFDVVHLSAEQEMHGTQQGAFWKGSPPQWADFFLGLDIDRPITGKIIGRVSGRLKDGRTHTVLFFHSPGAGGTTVALRVAWELHWQNPTVVLTKWSPAVPTRLQNLYALTQSPILLVADAAQLPETFHEQLFRELQRTPVVILYIQRILTKQLADGDETDEYDEGDAEPSVVAPTAGSAKRVKYDLVLNDPMRSPEPKNFCDAYLKLTDDPRRELELERITNDKELERYRSAFFYGLITFEREYVAVDRYVSTHLHGVRGKARDVLEYLAIITIYSDVGLPKSLVMRLMGHLGETDLDLEDLFRSGPARLLTVRGDRVRLMHQILAEEVLADLSAGGTANWILELPQLARELIRDLTDVAGPDSEILRELFRQLFVARLESTEDAEERQYFAPLIEAVDVHDTSHGQRILEELTRRCPNEPHFWNHRGRHQIFRMHRDFAKAEEYVLRAVALSPHDSIHYHTLGLVRRAHMRHVLTSAGRQSAADQFETARPLFDRAAAAFTKVREFDAENVYGYITHAQLILELADRMKTVVNADDMLDLVKKGGPMAEWLEQNIVEAEQLLSTAMTLYSTLNRSDSILTHCYARLEKLYGNIDEAIRLWEVVIARGGGGVGTRRALATAYLSRSERRWSALQASERLRVIELMEHNLRFATRTDEDFRMWFEAYRWQSEFDVNEAISRLRVWSEQHRSWRAFYYLYVLHFYLWFCGRSNSLKEMEEFLEQSTNLIIGKKNFSPLWFAYEPPSFPVLSDADVGPWPKGLGFFESPVLLRRINGVIDEKIPGPHAGTIRIDGVARAFFVPAKDGFSASKDENRPVNFYLGFSPIGLRAWEVKPDHVKGGDRSIVPSEAPILQARFVAAPSLSDESKSERAKRMTAQRVLAFIEDVVTARAAVGAELSVAELEGRINSAFGLDRALQYLGLGDLRSLLAKTGKYRVAAPGDSALVSHLSATESVSRVKSATLTKPQRIVGYVDHSNSLRGFGFAVDLEGRNYYFASFHLRKGSTSFPRKNQIVEYSPQTNNKGPVAADVVILDDTVTLFEGRVVSGPALKDLLASKTREILGAAHEKGQEITVTDLSAQLEKVFRGGERLVRRLGIRNLEEFLWSLDGVVVANTYPVTVRLDDTHAFGRLPGSRSLSTSEIEKAKTLAVEIVRDLTTRGVQVRVDALDKNLRDSLTVEGSVAARLGYRSFSEFLEDIAELRVVGRHPDQVVILRE
jgi:hypothetical protein